MTTIIPLIIGIILSVIFYGITLLLTRVRIISMMISALTPVILFVMSLVMVNFDLVNLNIVFSGTIIGIIIDRKSTRLNSSHVAISYAVFCLKKKKKNAKHR